VFERFVSLARGNLDAERRASLPIQVGSRWALVVTALLVVNLHPGIRLPISVGLNGLIGLVATGNALLQLRLRSSDPVHAWQPAVVSVIDVVAITGAVAVADQFDNSYFVFYYPSFVAFTLVFPGVASYAYALLTLAGYLVVAASWPSFEIGNPADLKALAVRLMTLLTVVAIANLAVRVERTRRLRAVQEALAAHLEPQRVTQEIHDGIAQEIYMLAVNLEANTKRIEGDPELRERMEVLTDLARRALLETRSLLFNLGPVLTGDQGLLTLLSGQVAEFSAVTRIPVQVTAVGVPPHLRPEATVEVYRIVQEALANIYRHADATSGSVSLRNEGATVLVRVADDGRGFDSSMDGRRGRGLSGMRDRAGRIGGELLVSSTPGGGTAVELRIPQRKD
jgi:signal transduction histidine kinase